MIYLDYNATTPCDPRVIEEMLPFFREIFANPSSLHRPGQEARQAVEKARSSIAHFIGAKEEEIIFTSGGTESNNLAIRGVAQALRKRGTHVVTSTIEHHAVLNVFRALEKEGFSVTYLPVDRDGIVHPEELRKALRPDTILVSIMHANNETGVIEPIADLARIAHEGGAVFHTDAVQTVGKVPIDVNALGVDLLAASAHKFYGPKGVGFLYVRKGTPLAPQILGGRHERGKRAGTENVPGIIGMAKACEIAAQEMEEETQRVGELRDTLEKELEQSIPDISVVGRGAPRLYNTSLILVAYVEGESLLLNLDFEGICVSSGSACTSSSLEPSHVLLAHGYSHELAHGSIRFSLGKWTTREEISQVVTVFPRVVEKLRAISPFWSRR
ncbi:cysteine desulfurase NifS [Candidatus Caldatribacterium sp.]|uniref:cysteine desulfurase NifS n=1 Tax=Candidatus Caldatribacterium sp. TaxID=2282143 RepID=UPI0029966F7E|nr:cysteine desulfurase NifS [Candidatus Caldatribacterium sp.]MDW8081407.1 cysteine desulfurase NifS [Candidatus Calescibacterium sp.]